jgi:hypothetical protein
MVEAIKPSKPVMVDVRAVRNIRHHCMLFSLLREVIDGGAWDGSEEALRDAVKIACGCVDTIIGLDGRAYFKPRSMAFESMSQDEFAKFFDRAVFYVSTRLLGDDDWQALRDRIGEIVDGSLRERVANADRGARRSA